MFVYNVRLCLLCITRCEENVFLNRTQHLQAHNTPKMSDFQVIMYKRTSGENICEQIEAQKILKCSHCHIYTAIIAMDMGLFQHTLCTCDYLQQYGLF